jgi:cyclin T
MGNDTQQAERWYFTKDQIRASPSVKDGIDHAKELGYRQQCANLIQDIGQRLQVTQLVINTAIVYMHRFYMLHSFSSFKRNTMGPCFLFLACKVEEHPRPLVHVLKATHLCVNQEGAPFDPKSDEYMKLSQELVDNESVLLQTLGFEVAVDHPNTYVVKCVQLVKASKELAQTAYFLATNSLHLTVFCIQYKPTVVACVCIYVACLWAHYVIPPTDSKNWYEFIDNSVTNTMLEELSAYFIKILDSCPTKLKRKLTQGQAVVYKEGKGVVAKPSSSTSTSTSSSDTNSSKDPSSSKSMHGDNNTDNIPLNVKTQLKGLLKPQPHESTPPPSRTHPHSHHHHKKHNDPHKKLYENSPHNSSPKTTSSSSASKSHDPSKVKREWAPQQIEEYNKRRKEKEKEKQQQQQQQQRKREESSGGKTTTPKVEQDSSARMKRPHDGSSSGTPMKKVRPVDGQKPSTADWMNHSSADDDHNKKQKQYHQSQQQQQQQQPLPPPPPPPRFSGGGNPPPHSSKSQQRPHSNSKQYSSHHV